MKVLLVEDEYLVAMAMQRELSTNGIECLTTSTAATALDIAHQERPDLVLMDIGLPGPMNGIQAARKIHETKRIPVCFISGYSNREITPAKIGFEPAGFLQKPIAISSITSLVRSLRTSAPVN